MQYNEMERDKVLNVRMCVLVLCVSVRFCERERGSKMRVSIYHVHVHVNKELDDLCKVLSC